MSSPYERELDIHRTGVEIGKKAGQQEADRLFGIASRLVLEEMERLQAQNTALQEQNNQLLDRAKRAEFSLEAIKVKHGL